MKHYSLCFSSFLLIVLTLSSIGGFSEAAAMHVNYYDFVDPGKWYFIPGGLSPPWQLHIRNQLVYNESTLYPAKIMMGQNTSKGPSHRLDLGFFRNFILQVNLSPDNTDSQVSEIPWFANNATIITLSHSYLSISNESLKLLKRPFTEFRLDFLVFWSANQVLFGGQLYFHGRRPQVPSNPVSAFIYNLSGGISSIHAMDLALFVVALLTTYKGWIFLLKRLEGKR